MAKRVDELDTVNAISSDDKILIVNDPAGVPETVIISYANFFANINVNVQANVVRANNLILHGNTTPPANSIITGMNAGRLWMGSDNYLYYSANSSYTLRMGPFVAF